MTGVDVLLTEIVSGAYSTEKYTSSLCKQLPLSLQIGYAASLANRVIS